MKGARSFRLCAGVAAVAGTFALVSAQPAAAGHYHVNCNNHGFVHGSSTTDNGFHSRVEGGPCNRSSRCDVGDAGVIWYYGAASAGVTCDNFMWGYAECRGNAWTRLTDVFDFHRHDAHSSC